MIKHPVTWTWYRIQEGQEVVIQVQTISYRTHAAAFNASQDTRYRGNTWALGQVKCSCVLDGLA